MAELAIYGIKNCNSVKKALDWLSARNVPYLFHDFKKVGADTVLLTKWANEIGWETLLNKKGTTWRRLSPEIQQAVVDSQSAVALMTENTSLIKRPVIEHPTGIIVGFNEDRYEEVFS